MRKDAWAYLTALGGCQVFLTTSGPDASDPNARMAADKNLSYKEALSLTASQRGEILAKNPAAASKIFQ